MGDVTLGRFAFGIFHNGIENSTLPAFYSRGYSVFDMAIIYHLNSMENQKGRNRLRPFCDSFFKPVRVRLLASLDGSDSLFYPGDR